MSAQVKSRSIFPSADAERANQHPRSGKVGVVNKNQQPNSGGLQTLVDLHFPHDYHAKGRIFLPSADLVEPFEAWYSWKNRRSRIDYYNSSVKTFQRGDRGKYGTMYEIVPKFDYRHHKHYEGCWMKKGKKDKKVEPQSVIPKKVFWPFKMNLTEFKFAGFSTINKVACHKWIAKVTRYNRSNTYKFYTSIESTPKPIRYEMYGYDIVLTSYYDNYTFEYDQFENWTYNASVFDIPHAAKRDRWCWNISKTLGDAGTKSLNPIEELLDPESIDDAYLEFNVYKVQHNISERDELEDRKRQTIFAQNVRYIQSMNRRNLGYELGINHFAHMTTNEISQHLGMSFDTDDKDYPGKVLEYFPVENNSLSDISKGSRHGTRETLTSKLTSTKDLTLHPGRVIPYDTTTADSSETGFINTATSLHDVPRGTAERRVHEIQKEKKREHPKIVLPKELDWRKYGAVGPVRSQAICGSCWSFSTTAAVESSHFIKTGKMVKLSEQMLIDCTWYIPNSKEGNNGCLGGWTWKALAYINRFGLATEESYGKYKGMEGRCKEHNITTISIDSYKKIKPHDPKAVMTALYKYGPVTASINTSPKTLKFYKRGVYNDKACTSSSDHSVLIVGYGRKHGKLYWIVKNSWSEHWGDKGYILIRNGHCGILNRPWTVITRNRKIVPR